MSMLPADAIAQLKTIQDIANASSSPAQAMRAMQVLSNDKPQYWAAVRSHGSIRDVVRWLRAWGRHPATYCYALSGGNDATLEYRYLSRRGIRKDDVNTVMQEKIRATFRDYAPETGYEHDIPHSLKQEAEYE